jgi:hypothetical protein
MLPGWKKSKGARLEHAIAHRLGMNIYDASGWLKLDDEPSLAPDAAVTVEHVQKIVGVLKGEPHKAVKVPNLMDGMKQESVAQEAQRLVHGNRGADYGHPLDDFTKTATIWSVILGHPVTPEQVGLCMIGVKLSRELHRPKRDNLVDICGYAETVHMIHEEKRRREAKAI